MRSDFISKQGQPLGLVELQGKSKCWKKHLKGGDSVGGTLSSLQILMSMPRFSLSFRVDLQHDLFWPLGNLV